MAGGVAFSDQCASGIGVGIAFDGTNLWYSCYASSTDLYRADPVTGQVSVSYSIAGGLGALAYDASRNAIWAGWGGNTTGDVLEIQLDAGKNVTSSTVAFSACVDNNCASGLDDGIAYDGGSDTLYVSPDGATVIHHYSITGTPLDSFSWAGQGCYNSGLSIGDQLLYEGSDGCNHVWVVDKSNTSAPVFDFSTAVAGDPNFRDEGLACDTNTFASQGVQVMWSKEAYTPMRAHAFVIPSGSCGVGGLPATSEINVAPGNEPSIAVDPLDPNHVVIGYNHGTLLGTRCSWSETNDGGKTWVSGLLPGDAHSNYGTDPTVRFASDGSLEYACLVATAWSVGLHAHARDVRVELLSASIGSPSSFQPGAIVTNVHQTCRGTIALCNQQGVPLDHPGLAIVHSPTESSGNATRALVCWTDYTAAKGHIFVNSRDENGALGVQAQVGSGSYCFMSGTPTRPAVSWLNTSSSALNMRVGSGGGASWASSVSFPTPNLLSQSNVTARVLASPTVTAVDNGGGTLRAIVSVRKSGEALVYTADESNNWLPGATTPVGNGTETFLPSSGNCSNAVGAYVHDQSGSGYGYAIWTRSGSGQYSNAFQTGTDMTDGYSDPRFIYSRIGDYTGMSCNGTTAWFAWTDSHNGLAIHATRLTVPAGP